MPSAKIYEVQQNLQCDDNPNARDTLSFKIKCQVNFFA